MENPRPEKVAVVDEVKERLDSTSATLLTEYRGLDVTAISDLRRALRAAVDANLDMAERDRVVAHHRSSPPSHGRSP